MEKKTAGIGDPTGDWSSFGYPLFGERILPGRRAQRCGPGVRFCLPCPGWMAGLARLLVSVKDQSISIESRKVL